MIRTTKTIVGLLALAWLVMARCGRGQRTTVMHGSVACGGENVSGGTVSFVPIEAGVGRISIGRILEGQYRIDAAGGVPQGKYRVQVDLGENRPKIQGNNGIEQAMIDEQVAWAPRPTPTTNRH